VESRLAHRLDPSRWSDCGYSSNLEPCSSHALLQTNRRSATCVRWRGRTGGLRRWSLDRGRKINKGSGRRGGCIFIRQGAFLTMEHLLAMMVNVPLSPGWMHIHSARCISENGALVTLFMWSISANQEHLLCYCLNFILELIRH
jgi:hypothetical protein